MKKFLTRLFNTIFVVFLTTLFIYAVSEIETDTDISNEAELAASEQVEATTIVTTTEEPAATVEPLTDTTTDDLSDRVASQSSAVVSLAQWLEDRIKTSTNFYTTTTTTTTTTPTYKTLPSDFETEPIKEITKNEPTTKRFTTTHIETKEEPLIGKENDIALKRLFVILVTYIVIVSTIMVAYKYLRQ